MNPSMRCCWVLFPVLVALLVLCQPATAQVPKTISYQGVLTDAGGTPVADATYTLTLKLYTTATGGSALWTEAQSAVTSKGIFSVVLGTVTSLDCAFDKAYWLGVAVGGAAEMTPRVRLTASPYSFHSVNADTARWVNVNFGATGSVASGTPLGNGPGWIFKAPNGERRDFYIDNGGTVVDDKLFINRDGNVGVGTYSWPGTRLGVGGDLWVQGTLKKEFAPGTGNVVSPIAFGTVNSDGTLGTATPNVSSAWNSSSSLYEITINGVTVTAGQYTVVATPFGNGTAATGAGNGKLYVFIRNTAGTLSQIGFSFMVFKP
jgi:hypothetical protein